MRGLSVLAALAALVVAPVASAKPTSPRQVEVVVGFEDAASAAKRAKALAEAGARVDERLPKLDAAVVTVPAAGVAAALAELRADPAVRYAGREQYRRGLLTPNDPGYTASSWPYLQAALPNAWDLTTGQTSVVIAVLDSGIDYAHPDNPPLAPGYDFVNKDSNPADDNGHGTAVTGALAAKLDNGVAAAGVCPGCTVMPVKVLNNVAAGSDADIASGITWAVDNGARVINLSLGGTGFTSVLQDAVNYALTRNVLLVAAGGNDGTSAKMYPASFEGVLGVAATTSTNTLESFSNRGQHLDLAAAGCLRTTLMGGGLGESCGTSIASPIVAGVAGLLLSRTPTLNRVQLESSLTGSANGSFGLDVKHGLLDGYKALVVGAALPPVPVNTALPQISGTLELGETLSATRGTWTNNPTAYAYTWERCNVSGAACAPITGATGAGYQVTGPDVGGKLRVTVKATNSGGDTSATSALTALVGGTAPLPGSKVDVYTTISASTTAPTAGSTVVYRVVVAARPTSAMASKVTLTLTMPTGLSHVESKASRGSGCTVAGQTVTCDLGHFVPSAEAEVLVTAKVGSAGMVTVLASATASPDDGNPADNMVTQTVTVPGPAAPAPSAGPNQALPSVTIAGEARVGATLTADPGSGWAGRGPHTFGYQWMACATVKGKLRCSALAGQTAGTLAITRSLVGKRLQVLVVALASDSVGELRESGLTDAVRR